MLCWLQGVCIARGDSRSRSRLLALLDEWWALPNTVPSMEKLKRETPWEQKAIHLVRSGLTPRVILHGNCSTGGRPSPVQA